MEPVVIESPYAGDVERNILYARACLKDALNRGEAPFASHLLYTQPGVLDDTVSEERKLGMEAGFVWGALAKTCAVYVDYGVTPGMLEGIRRAETAGLKVDYRTLEGTTTAPTFDQLVVS